VNLIALLGASGHGKVVADVAERLGMQVHFYDDAWPTVSYLGGRWAVHGDCERLRTNSSNYEGIVVSIGSCRVRLDLQAHLRSSGAKFMTLIHPHACVSRYSRLGLGSVVMAGAVVNADTEIGAACIVNTGATVDHDCVVGDGVHIAPGAHLSGNVSVSAGSWIGVGACIKQGIKIGAEAVIGAGAVVVKDVPNGVTVFGNPARQMY
jgi:sugar O-acyltransferase (sialic acid O-acetyltransferase NeuD family)